jgi:hypothetical protein
MLYPSGGSFFCCMHVSNHINIVGICEIGTPKLALVLFQTIIAFKENGFHMGSLTQLSYSWMILLTNNGVKTQSYQPPFYQHKQI